jgi:hypothetical protein
MPMFSPITIKPLAAFSFLLSGSFALAQTAQSNPPLFYLQLDPDMQRVVLLWDDQWQDNLDRAYRLPDRDIQSAADLQPLFREGRGSMLLSCRWGSGLRTIGIF